MLILDGVFTLERNSPRFYRVGAPDPQILERLLTRLVRRIVHRLTGDGIDPPSAPLTWAQRLKRVFDIDITRCPLCGGQPRVIADITDPDLIRKILDHINSLAPPRLPSRPAKPHPTPPDLIAER